MSAWPSTRARQVLAALLLRIGWVVKRQTGSHRTLAREGWAEEGDHIHVISMRKATKREREIYL